MSSKLPSSASSKGVAAVELTIWLPVLLLLLGAGLFLGRLFWHYTVAQKAAHDAARFLASATITEMRTPPIGGGFETPVAAVARKIAEYELSELNPGSPYAPQVAVLCDGVFTCNGQTVPRKITVSISMSVADDFFPDISYTFVGSDAVVIRPFVTVNYVGN